MKDHLVYKIQFGGTVWYLTEEGPTADKSGWSTNKGDAKVMTNKQACNLNWKFRKGLDKGARNPYGFAHKDV